MFSRYPANLDKDLLLAFIEIVILKSVFRPLEVSEQIEEKVKDNIFFKLKGSFCQMGVI
jgi:hypothetical protein